MSRSNERGLRLIERLGFRVVPNQHPRPHPNSGLPGVIGILEAESSERARRDASAQGTT